MPQHLRSRKCPDRDRRQVIFMIRCGQQTPYLLGSPEVGLYSFEPEKSPTGFYDQSRTLTNR